MTLGLLITVGLWWTYFDRFAVAEERLRDARRPGARRRDAYSYLHLLLVAGIIIFAAGVKYVVHAAGDPLRRRAATGAVRRRRACI